MKKIFSIILILSVIFGSTSFASDFKLKVTNVKVTPSTALVNTKLSFYLYTTHKVTIKIFDSKNILKKTLASSKTYNKGTGSIVWNLSDSKNKRVAAGKYKIILVAFSPSISSANSSTNSSSKTLTKPSLNTFSKSIYLQVLSNNKVNLENMAFVSSVGVSVWTKPKDTFKNTYSTGLVFSAEGIREIELNKKYKQFKGTIVIPYEDAFSRNYSRIKIYLDDVIVFETISQGRISESVNFQIDVSNAEKIRINEFGEMNGFPEKPPRLGFVNSYFYKK